MRSIERGGGGGGWDLSSTAYMVHELKEPGAGAGEMILEFEDGQTGGLKAYKCIFIYSQPIRLD